MNLRNAESDRKTFSAFHLGKQSNLVTQISKLNSNFSNRVHCKRYARVSGKVTAPHHHSMLCRILELKRFIRWDVGCFLPKISMSRPFY